MADKQTISSLTYMVTVTTTQGRIALASTGISNLAGKSALVQNSGTAPIFILDGNSTVTAVMPATGESKPGKLVLPGQAQSYSFDPSSTHFAVIAKSGTVDVYLSVDVGE